MRTPIIVRFALSLLILCSTLSATYARPSRHEVRAVWITTAAGLDWPRSTNKDEQQQSLRAIVANLKSMNFNTIFFQVRSRGDAYYRSTYEPWAENLTGTLGKNPGWDPLALLLKEAHAAGMEVHAWFNVYKVRGPNRIPSSNPQHPARAHAEWVVDVENEGWFDPGIPAVRAYLIKIGLELVRSYDIDGIQFDFARYPGLDFPDEKTFRRYGTGMKREDWRRSNIDKFIAVFYDSATAIKPMLKIGSAPIGVYNVGTMQSGWGAYHSYFQNSRGWLGNHKQDYLVPQLYWDMGETTGDPDFAALAEEWQSSNAGRHVYAGLGVYKEEVMAQMLSQIDTSRTIGTLGQAFFRYEHIRDAKNLLSRYETPALPPPMPWKDSIPTNPPLNLVATELSPEVFHLEWTAPQSAADGDTAKRYSIYRSTRGWGDAILVALTNTQAVYYVDTVRVHHGPRYAYAVCAVDKGNNESAPCMAAPIVVNELAALKRLIAAQVTLSTAASREDTQVQFAGYKVAERTTVLLTLFKSGVEQPIATIVDQEQGPGTYVVSLPTKKLAGGSYLVRLQAGNTRIERGIDVVR